MGTRTCWLLMPLKLQSTESDRVCGWFGKALGFLAWITALVVAGTSIVLLWVLFFECLIRPVDGKDRVKWGGVWCLIAGAAFHARCLIRSNCGPALRNVLDQGETFFAAALLCVISNNVAFYLHVPEPMPLKDIGFMAIPEQAVDSAWRAVSEFLTMLPSLMVFLQTCFMTEEERCIVHCAFFRLMTVCYVLRAVTVPLTILPGPAPHCRPGSLQYNPPKDWIDVVTRVETIYGEYFTCGDLIFSGHMCFLTISLLLYLRVLHRHWKRYSRLPWSLGMLYLATAAILFIAGRKHYTVDVALGIIISFLVFFHFEHGWCPACTQPSRKGATKELQSEHLIQGGSESFLSNPIEFV